MILAVNATRKNIFTLFILVLIANVIHTRTFLIDDQLSDVSTRPLHQHPGRQANPFSPSAGFVLHGVVFRGKGIPYAETYEEQRLRFLWESQPFETVHRVVSNVLSQQRGHDRPDQDRNINNMTKYLPLLRRIENPDKKLYASIPDATGYEDLFQNLYCNNDETSRTPRAKFPTPNENTRSKKWGGDKVQHFALVVAYRGNDFCGWQRQPNNNVKPSVQGTLEDSLQSLLLSSSLLSTSTSSGRQQKRPNLRVCGRTDSGVHAVGQVCRFRTTKDQNVTASMIQNHLNQDQFDKNFGPTSPRQNNRLLGLKCLYAQRVPRSFHPTFGATCRAYMYLVDIPRPSSKNDMDSSGASGMANTETSDTTSIRTTATTTLTWEQIGRLNDMLQYLENKELDYIGLSYGKLKTQTSNCTLYHAKVNLVEYVSLRTDLDSTVQTTSTALCIELVGNRFLRRMVRLLVSTALRQVFARQHPPTEDALYRLISERDRTLAHQSAPPDGLIFVGARFSSET